MLLKNLTTSVLKIDRLNTHMVYFQIKENTENNSFTMLEQYKVVSLSEYEHRTGDMNFSEKAIDEVPGCFAFAHMMFVVEGQAAPFAITAMLSCQEQPLMEMIEQLDPQQCILQLNTGKKLQVPLTIRNKFNAEMDSLRKKGAEL
jgi:hypothetical protein